LSETKQIRTLTGCRGFLAPLPGCAFRRVRYLGVRAQKTCAYSRL